MLHVQHLMGIGHQRRAAALTRALCTRGVSVCYVSGGYRVPDLDLGGAELVQLPAARTADARYESLLDENGAPIDGAWRASRAKLLLQTFERVQPSVLLIETFPFGRKLLSFELIPLLEAAARRDPRPKIFTSVRDVLEPKRKPGRNEKIVQCLQRYFDAVLVHSDPKLIPLSRSFALTEQIAPKIRYTGYVVERVPAAVPSDLGRGEVLVSTGGGVVGERLLRAALRARAFAACATGTWRCLAGHSLPEPAFEALRREAPPGVVVQRNRADFPVLLGNCAVSVSQAGYNTVLEALSAGARCVLVPFAAEGEREQSIRTRALHEHGLVEMLAERELSPETLAAGIDRAMVRAPAGVDRIDFDGAAASAALIVEALSH